MPIEYNKNTIYKLCCKDPNITSFFIGATCAFKEQKWKHKTRCMNKIANDYEKPVYEFIRNNGGFSNWEMIMVEEYPVKNKLEKDKRLRYWIEQLKPDLSDKIIKN